jgi:hypothetical protein
VFRIHTFGPPKREPDQCRALGTRLVRHGPWRRAPATARR